MEKKKGLVKIYPIILKQALRQGKSKYKLLIIIGAILNLRLFFSLRIIEELSNTGYAFYLDNNLDFIETALPLFILLGIELIFNIAQRLYWLLDVRVNKDLGSEYDLELRRKLSSLPWEKYEDYNYSMKMELINQRGKEGYVRLSKNFTAYAIRSLINVAIFTYFVSKISLLIASIFVLASILYFFVGYYFGNKFYAVVRDNKELRKRRTYAYRVNSTKESHQDVLVNRLYKYLTNKWSNLNDDWMNKEIKAESKYNLYIILPGIFYSFIAFWLIYVVLSEVSLGNQEIGYFVLILSSLVNYKHLIQNLAFSLNSFQRDVNIYQDYLDVMSYESDLTNTNKYLPEEFAIDFNNVSYQYIQSDFKALNRFSISIKSHETLAIVGLNGSGKTTFVNLLMELSKRYDGNILVNGKNVNNEMGIIRNSSSVIFQDFAEYQLTIKDNIVLGDLSRKVSDKEVWEILDQVGLKKYVNNLPNKLDTILGQIKKGTELSKGQWQRLAVARLLVNKNAKIWILDEPTAYLDPIAEIDMYNFIYNLKGNRSVIFISHRLGFAKKAQKIAVFKDGRIIEEDTHSNLIKNQNSDYSKMYNKQKKWYE